MSDIYKVDNNLYDDYEEKTAIIEEKSIIKNLKDTKAYLIEIYGENLGKKIEIETDRVLIGRDVRSDIIINSNSVSRQHAEIYRKYIDFGNHNTFSTFWIRDLDSTNGTYIGDQAVSNIELKNGDTVKIGSTIFKFVLGSNVETAYFEEIYRLTIVDGLTEIFNKRYFLETLDKEINRSKRYKRPLSLIMFDIDFFKKINDRYGHLTGDYVLKRLAKIVKDSIRSEEIFSRYGGEEFSILMPESSKRSAILLAEKIRVLIKNNRFEFEGHIIPVTVSLGVAAVDSTISTGIELIALADKNLYRAKKSGRNCVVG